MITLGVYMAGEVPPERLEYTYLDRDGTAITLDGYTAIAVVQNPAGVRTEIAATVEDAAAGRVSVGWAASMTNQPGGWSITIWVGDTYTKLASPVLYYNVADDTAPTF